MLLRLLFYGCFEKSNTAKKTCIKNNLHKRDYAKNNKENIPQVGFQKQQGAFHKLTLFGGDALGGEIKQNELIEGLKGLHTCGKPCFSSIEETELVRPKTATVKRRASQRVFRRFLTGVW